MAADFRKITRSLLKMFLEMIQEVSRGTKHTKVNELKISSKFKNKKLVRVDQAIE